MKLLLIDKRVRSKELINARNDSTDYIEFDYFIDTYATLSVHIKEKSSEITDIAIVQHANLAIDYNILFQQSSLTTAASDLRDWLLELKESVKLQRLDLLACALYSNNEIKAAIEWLEKETEIDLRASINFTGNPEKGGSTEESADWVMESDNVDIRQNYFTDAISEFKELLYTYSNSSMYGANKIIKDIYGNIIHLHKDIYGNPINPPYDICGRRIKYPISSVVTWGNPAYGGDPTYSQYKIQSGSISSNVIAVYSNAYAFAALKSDGSVVVWGNYYYGGYEQPLNVNVNIGGGITTGGSNTIYTGKPQNLSNVVSIYSTSSAFAALKLDGSVVVWGYNNGGGSTESNSYSTGAPSSITSSNSNVTEIYSASSAFAALKSDGSVVSWGYNEYGGDSSSVAAQLAYGVVSIYSNYASFAALKSNGSVITWGRAANGGDSSSVASQLASGVIAIYSTSAAFAALKSDGSVVSWGDSLYGGNSSAVVNKLQSGVVRIYSNASAFAALKSDSSVVVWGNHYYGGYEQPADAEIPNSQFTGKPDNLSNVVSIYSTSSAFAALKSDGSVVTWGSNYEGGSGAPSSITSSNSGVLSIYSTMSAFAALKSDGSVVSWGDITYGGINNNNMDGSIVVKLYSTERAFAALKSDGSVVAWGNTNNGGNPYDLYTGIKSGDISSNIISIYSSQFAFAALKTTNNSNPSTYYTSSGSTKLDAFKMSAKLFITKEEINLNESTIVFSTMQGGVGTYNVQYYELIPGQSPTNISTKTPSYISISENRLIITNASIFKRSTKVQYTMVVTDSDIPARRAEAAVYLTFVGYEANLDLTTTITFQGSNILTATSPQQQFTLPFNNTSAIIQVDASGGARPVKYTLQYADFFTIIEEKSSNLNKYTHTFVNNYSVIEQTTIQYKVVVDDGATQITIPFEITYLPYIPLRSSLMTQTQILYIIPPTATTLKINDISGGEPEYYYAWYGQDPDTLEFILLQLSTINAKNLSTFEITADDSVKYAGKSLRYYCEVTDSRPTTPNIITINYIVNFIFIELEYTITAYKNNIQIDLSNSYTLNYNNQSLKFVIDISSGITPYSYALVEKIEAGGELLIGVGKLGGTLLDGNADSEIFIDSYADNKNIFILKNEYDYVGTAATKLYEIYIKDSSIPQQRKFYTFSVDYLAYQPITASQNFTRQVVPVNQNSSMEPINVSGGKSGVYTYKWYISQMLTGVEALNTNSPEGLSFDLYTINNGPLIIQNSQSSEEGVQKTFFYMCEISDTLETTPIQLYFKIIYDAYYAIDPCIDGEVEVHTTDGLVKVKNLTTSHSLLNIINNTTFQIYAIYTKEIESGFYNIPFGTEYELYSSTAIINTTSLLYEFMPTSRYSQNLLPSPQPRRLMYHIFTNQFIKGDIFTKNGLQLKSYGTPSSDDANYLLFNEFLNGYYLTYLFTDTLPDKELSIDNQDT
jgi:alpha-tubulin suppressor-like RCC1 family protein